MVGRIFRQQIKKIECLRLLEKRPIISCGKYHTVALKTDGTVYATGDNEYGQCDVDKWTDIVAVWAGDDFTVGLRSDGTVASTKGSGKEYQFDTSTWTDIVDIVVDRYRIFGLKKNGMVVATGYNYSGNCDVSAWRNVCAISLDENSNVTIGLCTDGTIVLSGCVEGFNTSSWRNITDVASHCTMLGLNSDGTVNSTGNSYNGEDNVKSWKNISRIYTNGSYSLGLDKDRKVYFTGKLCDEVPVPKTDTWSDIVVVKPLYSHIVALKANGTVVADGSERDANFSFCKVNEWKDIIAIDCGYAFTLGLKSDGTLITTGPGYKAEYNSKSKKFFYTDIGSAKVSGWHDIGSNRSPENPNSYGVYIAPNSQTIESAKADTYNHAMRLASEGKAEAAADLLTEISDYKDSSEQVKEILYTAANKEIANGKLNNACRMLLSIREYKDADKLLKSKEMKEAIAVEYPKLYTRIGSYVKFGSYEQDNNASNGTEEIEWLVLDYDRVTNSVLLLSRYGLDVKYGWYGKLNDWLNNQFLRKAFTATEQKAIKKTTVEEIREKDSSGYETSYEISGAKIWLLSKEELTKYNKYLQRLNGKVLGGVLPTAYAKTQGSVLFKEEKVKSDDGVNYVYGCQWWLRTGHKIFEHYVMSCGEGHSMHVGSEEPGKDGVCVRPALWLDLNLLQFK